MYYRCREWYTGNATRQCTTDVRVPPAANALARDERSQEVGTAAFIRALTAESWASVSKSGSSMRTILAPSQKA